MGKSLGRIGVAAVLVGAALAIPLAAWYVTGNHSALRATKKQLDEPERRGREVATQLAYSLSERLENLRKQEALRPFYHYNSLTFDPKGQYEGDFVVPSPLAQGPSDPFIRAHFQIDQDAKLTLPTLNDEAPEINSPGDVSNQKIIQTELSSIAFTCNYLANQLSTDEQQPKTESLTDKKSEQPKKIESPTKINVVGKLAQTQWTAPPVNLIAGKTIPQVKLDQTKIKGKGKNKTKSRGKGKDSSINPNGNQYYQNSYQSGSSKGNVQILSTSDYNKIFTAQSRYVQLKNRGRGSSGYYSGPQSTNDSLEQKEQQVQGRNSSRTNRQPNRRAEKQQNTQQQMQEAQQQPQQAQQQPQQAQQQPQQAQQQPQQAQQQPQQAQQQPQQAQQQPQQAQQQPQQAQQQPQQLQLLQQALPEQLSQIDTDSNDAEVQMPMVAIKEGMLIWHTIALKDRIALLALRSVRTPDGIFTQGFEVSSKAIDEFLENAPFPAQLSPGLPQTKVSAPLFVHGAPLYISVDVSRQIARAQAQTGAILTKFRWTFGIGAFIALLAGCLVILLVRESERLAQQRSQFAASAAHELRTPLAGLRMYGEMLAEGLGDPNKFKDYARRIGSEAERLGRVVGNVLNFSRLEQGNLTVNAESGDLTPVIKECISRQQATLEAAGASVSVDVPEGLPSVLFDRDAVCHILQNLLDNAEKYTREAKDRCIQVTLRPVEGEHKLALKVTDSGSGIPTKLGKKLFQPFERGGQRDAPAGLGLGLALSQALAKAQGGLIAYSKSPQGGAQFTVYFQPES